MNGIHQYLTNLLEQISSLLNRITTREELLLEFAEMMEKAGFLPLSEKLKEILRDTE